MAGCPPSCGGRPRCWRYASRSDFRRRAKTPSPPRWGAGVWESRLPPPKLPAAAATPAPRFGPPPMPLRQERAMKRLHVHVSVEDLEQSRRFYATLFAAEPTVVKDDYIKWMLDDPRVNFAISARAG